MNTTETPINCEIVASDSGLGNNLKQIAHTCATDLKIALFLKSIETSHGKSAREVLVRPDIPVTAALVPVDIGKLARLRLPLISSDAESPNTRRNDPTMDCGR